MMTTTTKSLVETTTPVQITSLPASAVELQTTTTNFWPNTTTTPAAITTTGVENATSAAGPTASDAITAAMIQQGVCDQVTNVADFLII